MKRIARGRALGILVAASILAPAAHPERTLAQAPGEGVGVTLVDEGWWLYNDNVNWVAIVRNDSSRFVEDVHGRLVLYRDDDPYAIDDPILADKMVLAPGEETVILARWLPSMNDNWPTRIERSISARPSERTASPYLAEAEVAARLTTETAGGWHPTRLRGWMVNVGDRAWRAIPEQPNEPWSHERQVAFPNVATVVFYSKGKVVRAARLFNHFETGWWAEAVPPGQVLPFEVRTSTGSSDVVDAYRIFTASEPAPGADRPLLWVVESASAWFEPDVVACPGSARCVVHATARVRNASDTPAGLNVTVAFRDASGQPVAELLCSSDEPVQSGASTECYRSLGGGTMGQDPSLSEVSSATIFASSPDTTTDPAFAARPGSGRACVPVVQAAMPTPGPGWEPTARLYLPSAQQAAGTCDR